MKGARVSLLRWPKPVEITAVLWNSLTDRLLWWLLVAAGLGTALPGPANALEAGVSIVLGVMIGGLGLTLSLRDLVAGFLRPKLIAGGIGAQLLSTPVVAFAIWQLADLPGAWIGLPVQAAAPSEITSPLMTQLAGGLLSGSISLLSVSVLMAPVTMPLLLQLILGRTVSIPVMAMLQSLLFTVALPVLAGSTTYTILGQPAVLRRTGPKLSALMVVLLIFIVVGNATNDLGAIPWARIGLMALGAAGLVLVGFGAGWLAGLVLRVDHTTSRVLIFTTGMREFGIASAVALGFFGAEAALFPAVYGVVMMVGSAWLAGRLHSGL